MPFTAEDLAKFRSYVLTNAAGYLRNTVREPLVTCKTCATPVDGYARCFACNQQSAYPGIANRVASLTYAISGTQSAHLMRGYKAQPPSPPHQALIALLLAIAVGGHEACASRLAAQAVTHWATVPSLPQKPGEHPLHRLVSGFMELPEVPLSAASDVRSPRSISADHFFPSQRLHSDAHVLLIDDTWTSGGHAQSCAIALHGAGAKEVSILTVARWIEPTYGDNRQFITDRLTSDFNPALCPWTSGACP